MSPRGVLVLAGGVFIVLAALVLLVGILPGDQWMREALLAAAPAPVLFVMRWANQAGSWRVLAPATVALVVFFPAIRRRWWVWVPALILASLLETAMKEVIGRPRPEGPTFGFPSGHATAAAAYFGALIYAAGELRLVARRAVRIGAAGMIVLVALARILLRAHWPSDALGGVALGLACASAAALISASTLRSPAESRSPATPSRD